MNDFIDGITGIATGERKPEFKVDIHLDDADLYKFLGGLFAVLLLAIIIGKKIG